jgi:hypothetical protein
LDTGSTIIMSSWIGPLRVVAPVLALLLLPAGLVAQEEADEAQLVGRVVSSITGEPIEAAAVSLRRSRLGAVTDSTGRFVVPSTIAGEDTIEVRYVGYQMSSVPVFLEAEKTTRVVLLLSPNVVRVAELEVEIERGDFRFGVREFERRKAKGIGHFITRDDLERWKSRDTSDALRRVPGLRVGASDTGSGQRPPIELSRNALTCEPVIFVDGLYLAGAHPDDVIVPDIGGIEVYTSPGSVPVQYATMASPTCGAILIWTRRGRRPGDPR